jgi:hypothetical protein
MLLAVAGFFIVEKWVDTAALRWTLLAAMGLLSMLWIVVRSIQISRSIQRDLNKNQTTKEV